MSSSKGRTSPSSIIPHAARRIQARGLTTTEIAAALAGREFRQINGYTLHYDRTSRCAVVLNPDSGLLVTAYRMKKQQLKRHYSK